MHSAAAALMETAGANHICAHPKGTLKTAEQTTNVGVIGTRRT
jgi:hypothetical protein